MDFTFLLFDIKGRSRPHAACALDTSTSSTAPPTLCRIVDDQTFDHARYGMGWRGGRRKEIVTLHQSPVTPRCSVLGHGHATDDAVTPLPAGSDNNSLNCQSL